jgi:hypothetical protein
MDINKNDAKADVMKNTDRQMTSLRSLAGSRLAAGLFCWRSIRASL